jgi:hypothetical protein
MTKSPTVWDIDGFSGAVGGTLSGSWHPRQHLKNEIICNSAEVKKNDDGSVDVYIGPKAPTGQEAPTDPSRKFELMFRLYEPKKDFFGKGWTLPLGHQPGGAGYPPARGIRPEADFTPPMRRRSLFE